MIQWRLDEFIIEVEGINNQLSFKFRAFFHYFLERLFPYSIPLAKSVRSNQYQTAGVKQKVKGSNYVTWSKSKFKYRYFVNGEAHVISALSNEVHFLDFLQLIVYDLFFLKEARFQRSQQLNHEELIMSIVNADEWICTVFFVLLIT